ncbi:MAG: hypothetical protein IJ699_08325 [Bacteroidaceae bacterium]|nr:hypothetical protein [Bacteroidaceae bacterium]
MKTFWIDIVGLTHCGVESYYKDYIEDSIGKRLTLLRDEMNPSDPFALKVKDRETTVGYVAATDLDIVHQALHATGRKRLTARVINISTDPPQLRAEVQCEAIDTDFDPYAQLPYDQWKWPDLWLLPPALISISERADDLIELLEAKPTDWNSVRALMTEFLTDNPSDTSREMNRTRQHILQLLEQNARQAATDEENERWLELALAMRTQKGQLMNHDTRLQTAHQLFIRWPQTLKRQHYEEAHYTFDNRLDELEQLLQQFPFHLYDTFLNDPVDFLRETFYKHVPRRQLFGLFSGIILMVLKGRVSVRRWGRDDDQQLRRELEQVVNFDSEETADRADRADHSAPDTPPTPLTTEQRAEALKRAIHRLLTAYGLTGKLLVFRKNQWAGIANVLINEHGLPSELTTFCKLMDSWGFGPEGDYPVPCDYQNIIKDSPCVDSNYEQRKERPRDVAIKAVMKELRQLIAEELQGAS